MMLFDVLEEGKLIVIHPFQMLVENSFISLLVTELEGWKYECLLREVDATF